MRVGRLTFEVTFKKLELCVFVPIHDCPRNGLDNSQTKNDRLWTRDWIGIQTTKIHDTDFALRFVLFFCHLVWIHDGSCCVRVAPYRITLKHCESEILVSNRCIALFRSFGCSTPFVSIPKDRSNILRCRSKMYWVFQFIWSLRSAIYGQNL